MTAWGIIATYFAAGTLGGALVGLLRPIASTRVGGTVVGALTGILVYGAINVAMEGWSGFDWRFALIAGVPVGGFIGYRFSGERW